jgi:hypothetical protein
VGWVPGIQAEHLYFRRKKLFGAYLLCGSLIVIVLSMSGELSEEEIA